MKIAYLNIIACVLGASSLQAYDYQQWIPPAVQNMMPGGSLGPLSLKGETRDSLDVVGPATLESVTLKGPLQVTGPLEAVALKAKNVDVVGPSSFERSSFEGGTLTGPAELKATSVEDDLTVYGPLKAKGTSFGGDLTVYTDEMTLKNSKTKAITIHMDKMSGHKKQPEVFLKGKTVVAGDITFKGLKGLVILDPKAKIEGKVINGEIRKAKH